MMQIARKMLEEDSMRLAPDAVPLLEPRAVGQRLGEITLRRSRCTASDLLLDGSCHFGTNRRHEQWHRDLPWFAGEAAEQTAMLGVEAATVLLAHPLRNLQARYEQWHRDLPMRLPNRVHRIRWEALEQLRRRSLLGRELARGSARYNYNFGAAAAQLATL
jgi:hypothetical protein